MVILWLDIVFYMALAWYFDHIISANRGVSDLPYFMFTRKYWNSWGKQQTEEERAVIREQRRSKLKKRKTEKVMADYTEDLAFGGNVNEGNEKIKKNQKESVQKEKRKVLDAEREGMVPDGLRVIGMRKTYYKKAFGRKSKDDIHAVRGVYLEVPDRELLCLLGHNGAGKSTLFNMLTGVLQPSGGAAKVCGLDVETQIDEIRLIIGVVPQFDILWGELTANEHMNMFCKIKGVPDEDIEAMTDELLTSVGLIHVKMARVANFSGGMKRRLSVAISSIGNPRIIFMDEPTTGMDPVSRKDVWSLI
jgi:ABC-type Na+ transport system ATPase subunit NatA